MAWRRLARFSDSSGHWIDKQNPQSVQKLLNTVYLGGDKVENLGYVRFERKS